jgi:hypothetical protein
MTNYRELILAAMNDNQTDLDRIAAGIAQASGLLIANTHAPGPSDSVTVTKDGWIAATVELARLEAWVTGLSETHKSLLDDGPDPDDVHA